MPLDQITPELVSSFCAGLKPDNPGRHTGDTLRARVYGLLTMLMNRAVRQRLIERSPCLVEHAFNVEPAERPPLPSVVELAIWGEAMPARLRLALDLAYWAGLRRGEILALRRGDFEELAGDAPVVLVRKSVTAPSGDWMVTTPKTMAGRRTVPLTRALAAKVQAHLADHVAGSDNALVFPSASDPGKPVPASTFYGAWSRARKAAGLPDGVTLHFGRHMVLTAASEVGGLSERQTMKLAGQVSRVAHARYREATLGAQRAALETVELAAANGELDRALADWGTGG
jgi:integrase